MEISLTTPALLFPAISLLLLAYTNRFLAIASLIRNLHTQYQENHNPKIKGQIDNLRKRLTLIRNMQTLGASSFLLCVICMFLIFWSYSLIAIYIFSVSLVFLTGSLALSVWEIQISVKALNIQLNDMEK